MSIAVRTLSFDVSAVNEKQEFGDGEYGGEYLAIAVRAKVDGRSPYSNEANEDTFDAVDVLALGTRSGKFDPYTCSCGVSGCAGIHDESQVQVDDALVHWSFPEKPFRKRLAEDLIPAGAPLTLTFDRKQYSEALADLQAQLEKLTDGLNGRFGVRPCHDPIPSRMGTDFARYIAKVRDNRDEYYQETEEREAADGALRDFVVNVDLPDGMAMRSYLSTIARATVPADVQDINGYLNDGHREHVLANPLAVLNAMTAQELEDNFWVSKWPEGSTGDEDLEGWTERFAGQYVFRVEEAPAEEVDSDEAED